MENDPTKRPTVNITQAAEIAQVSRRTIYNWLKTGKLAYVRTASGSVRIFSDSLFRPATPAPDAGASRFDQR